jgi:hypothetical protein
LTGVGLSFFKPKLLFVIATSLLIILSIHTILYIYYPTKKPEWRAATSLIIQKAKSGDAILFYSPVQQVLFEYYYWKMNDQTDLLASVYPFALRTPIGKIMLKKIPNPSEAMLESISERFDRIWVVLSMDIVEELDWNSRPITQAFESQYGNQEKFIFQYIRILLFKKG